MPLHELLKAQLQLLSDTVLYKEAVEFVNEHKPPDNNQLNGLLAYSGNLKVLMEYITRQRARDWGKGYKGHYAAFYGALERALRDMRELLPKSHPVTGKNLTKNETREALSILYHELIQHLVSHALFQNAVTET